MQPHPLPVAGFRSPSSFWAPPARTKGTSNCLSTRGRCRCVPLLHAPAPAPCLLRAHRRLARFSVTVSRLRAPRAHVAAPLYLTGAGAAVPRSSDSTERHICLCVRCVRLGPSVRVWQALLSLGNSKHLLLRMLSQPKGFEFLTQQVRLSWVYTQLSRIALFRAGERTSGPALLCKSH